MAVNYYFFDAVRTGDTYDRTYSAGDFARYLNKLVGNGVFPNPPDCLQVYAGTGMQVIVKEGEGWIEGRKIVNDADLPLDIDSSDVTLSRIDRVVFYADMVNREMGIRVKKGTNASSPTAPEVTRTQDLIEYSLATVRVNRQASSVTQSVITDTRLDSSVCGVVQGLVQQASTETLFAQWVAAFEEQHEEMQSEFDTWFEQIKASLSETKLMSEYTREIETTAASTLSVEIGISEYVHEVDVLNVYVNGMRLRKSEYTNNGTTITFDKPLDVVGTPIEIVVYKTTDTSAA